MKLLNNTTIALCLCSLSAQAEVVIDDFSDIPPAVVTEASSPYVVALDDDVAGTRTVTVTDGATSPGANAIFSNGLFRINALLGTVVTIVYDFASPLDLTGVLPTLSMEMFNSVVGSFDTVVTLTNTSAVSESFAAFSVPPLGVAGVHGTDLSAAVAGDIDFITIAITNTNSGTAVLEATPNASISAVPEPSSLALLGLTGLGGLFVARRRKRAVK